MFNKLLFAITILLVLASSAFANEVKLYIPKHVKSNTAVDIVLKSMGSDIAPGSISITYRPGSKVEKTTLLSSPPLKANQKVKVVWKPEEAGIARIDYKSNLASSTDQIVTDSKLVGVIFNATPVSGIIVMCLAAFILFGGCFFSLNLLMNGKKVKD